MSLRQYCTVTYTIYKMNLLQWVYCFVWNIRSNLRQVVVYYKGFSFTVIGNDCSTPSNQTFPENLLGCLPTSILMVTGRTQT